MPCVYILKSSLNGKFYTGSSREDNPLARLAAHNSGKTKSTKSGRPWSLVYFEKVADYTAARRRELFLKSGVGRKFVKEKIDSVPKR